MSTQLCHLWLSGCWPSKGECATKVFLSNRRGILWFTCSLILSSKLVGKFNGNSEVKIWLIDQGVEGSDMVSGSEKNLSDEISFLGHLPSLVHVVWKVVSSNVEDVMLMMGD